MLNTILTIVLCIFWVVMFLIIAHENRYDESQRAEMLTLWTLIAIFCVIGGIVL